MKRLLVQHVSRGATFDRYNTIRNFFRQQHLSPVSPLSHSARVHLAPSGSPTCTLRTRLILRQFSSHRTLLQDNQPRQVPGETRRQDGGPSENDKATPPRRDGSEGVSLEHYPRMFRRLAMSLPHLQRPTRDDFLKAADGFWQRMRIRFRWLTIRSFRRYNVDDLSAFLTWFLMSQTLWLFVGT